MHQNPRDAYLEAEVRTATPQRLRLMLIDGALRFARQSLDTWGSEEQGPESYNALVRCRGIVAELAGSIRDDSPLARRVKEVQLFLFRQLAEAPTHNDSSRLSDVIGVLEEERETWRQVCLNMPETPAQTTSTPGCVEIPASEDVTEQPPGGQAMSDIAPTPGFSLDA